MNPLGLAALQLRAIGTSVTGDASAQIPSLRTEDPHDIPSIEISFHVDDARGQQASSASFQCFGGSGIHMHAA